MDGESVEHSSQSSEPDAKKWKPSCVGTINGADSNETIDEMRNCNFQDFKNNMRYLANVLDQMDDFQALSATKEIIQKFSVSVKNDGDKNYRDQASEIVRVQSQEIDPSGCTPLETFLIVQKLMNYGSSNELLVWRQVSKLWNGLAAQRLSKSKWISLKNSTLLDYPYYKNQSITEFLSEISSTSQLYPLRKFHLTLHPVQESPQVTSNDEEKTAIIDPLFIKKYFNFITHLKIHYVFAEHFEENISPKNIDSSMAFLSPKYLPNLESLSLNVYSRQLFVPISDETGSEAIFQNFKALEIEVLSIGTRETDDRIFTEASFLYKLFKYCQLMESFELTANRGRITIMQQAMNLLYSLKLKHLSKLSFKSSTRGSRINLGSSEYSRLPPPFHLRSLTLCNIIAISLHEFLQQHKSTLDELRIKYSIILQTSDSDEFEQVLPVIPSLPKVHKLEFKYYPRSEMSLAHLLSKNYFPNLKQLDLKIINVSNWRNRNINDLPTNPDEQIHEQIKNLELDLSDGLLTGKAAFLHQFNQLKTCKLYCIAATFLNLQNSRSLSQTLTQLSLQIQDTNSNSQWDSVLTGINSNDIHLILNDIRLQFQKYRDDFELEKYDFDKSIRLLCKETPVISSVEYLQNLQKFEIKCSGNDRLRITDVTMVFLLKRIKSLTCIHICNSCIPDIFTKRIRECLPPSFLLTVKGISRSVNVIEDNPVNPLYLNQ